MTTRTPQQRPDSAPAHDHVVAFYDSDAALQQVAAGYLGEGLARGERLLAVVSPRTEEVLRATLDADLADLVVWGVDISYRGLGAMFDGYRRLFAEQRAAGTTVRLISEYHDDSGGGAAAERLESYVRMEAASNEVFSPFGHTWACLYDTRSYPEPLLHRVMQVHPATLRADDRIRANPDYRPPADYLTAHREQLQPVPDSTGVDVVLHGTQDLRDLRRALQSWTAPLPVDVQAVEPVLLVVGEAATNALQHGRPPVRVRAWRTGDDMHVRIDDHGDHAVPVTAGYQPPTGFGSGIGLFAARSVADTVRVVSGDGLTSVGLVFQLRR
jgi:anti-sigma regulatory factor (Ser/Thr protein kinase)